VLGLLGAVIVHICVLFLVSYYTRYSTWEQLQNSSQPYRFQSLVPDNPIMKTSDPLFQLAACYFNLTNGPVHITADGQVPFWSLSLYNHAGANIYSLNNRTAPNNMLDVIISDPVQIIDFKQAVTDTYENSVLTAQNIDNGFSILRVLKPSADWNKQVEAFLASASCKQVNY